MKTNNNVVVIEHNRFDLLEIGFFLIFFGSVLYLVYAIMTAGWIALFICAIIWCLLVFAYRAGVYFPKQTVTITSVAIVFKDHRRHTDTKILWKEISEIEFYGPSVLYTNAAIKIKNHANITFYRGRIRKEEFLALWGIVLAYHETYGFNLRQVWGPKPEEYASKKIPELSKLLMQCKANPKNTVAIFNDWKNSKELQ